MICQNIDMFIKLQNKKENRVFCSNVKFKKFISRYNVYSYLRLSQFSERSRKKMHAKSVGNKACLKIVK